MVLVGLILVSAPFIPTDIFRRDGGAQQTGEVVALQQEKNLAVLRLAIADDLVICAVPSKNTSGESPLKWAILVDANHGDAIKGVRIGKREIWLDGRSGEFIHSHLSSWDCEVRIVKEPFAHQTVGKIVMYGLGQEPSPQNGVK